MNTEGRSVMHTCLSETTDTHIPFLVATELTARGSLVSDAIVIFKAPALDLSDF